MRGERQGERKVRGEREGERKVRGERERGRWGERERALGCHALSRDGSHNLQCMGQCSNPLSQRPGLESYTF